MTQVLVNDIKFIEKLQDKATVNDLLDQVTNYYSKEDKIVTEMVLDGENINFDICKELLKSQVTKFKDIEFKLLSRMELAFDALDSCPSYIDELNLKIQKVVPLFKDNKLKQANILFGETIELLDLFIQLIASIHQTIKSVSGTDIRTFKTFQELEIHLLSVLKAILPAKEKNDIIMLCDLLEYELTDNLTQWKIKAIPELKKLKTC